jgi:tetratricopeptide (TPR) repeat protein
MRDQNKTDNPITHILFPFANIPFDFIHSGTWNRKFWAFPQGLQEVMWPVGMEAEMHRGCLGGLVLSIVAGCALQRQDDIRSLNQDGVYLFQMGAYKESRQYFVKALEKDPENIQLLYNKAQVEEALGNITEAERLYTLVLEKDPGLNQARHALVVLWNRTGRREFAQTQVESWMKSNPQYAQAYADDGFLWLQSGDVARAQARLQQALAINPSDLVAMIELGSLFESLNRPDRALALYERALDVRPNQVALQAKVDQMKNAGVHLPTPDR